MSNFYGVGRSNHFRVKDVAALREAIDSSSYDIVEGDQGDGQVTILCHDESGDWVFYRWADDDSEEDVEVDVIDIVAAHLAPGEVAIFQAVGHEKLRMLSGYSVAVNEAGERVTISIDDIYDAAAAAFGKDRRDISFALY